MLTIVSVLFLLVKKNILVKSSKYNSVLIYILTDSGKRTMTLDILG